LILAPPSGNDFKFDDFKRSFWRSRSSRNRIISAAESWATAGARAGSGDIISIMLSSYSWTSELKKEGTVLDNSRMLFNRSWIDILLLHRRRKSFIARFPRRLLK
jgi:hypothetical protein